MPILEDINRIILSKCEEPTMLFAMAIQEDGTMETSLVSNNPHQSQEMLAKVGEEVLKRAVPFLLTIGIARREHQLLPLIKILEDLKSMALTAALESLQEAKDPS